MRTGKITPDPQAGARPYMCRGRARNRSWRLPQPARLPAVTVDPGSSSTRGDADVLWFFGADAVGKSAVGWEAYTQLVQAGVSAAYVDLDYLGFCDPRPDDFVDLVASNLCSLWRNFADRGIRCLVVSGIVVTAEDRRQFTDHLDHPRLQLVLLRARTDTIHERIVRRRQVEAQQQDATLSVDVLHELNEYATRSAQFARLLDDAGIADVVVDTDAAPPSTLAAQILGRTGLLSRS